MDNPKESFLVRDDPRVRDTEFDSILRFYNLPLHPYMYVR